MQAAEFSSLEAAALAETALTRLIDEYTAWEKTAEQPWSEDAVPQPLVDFGTRHGVPWPADKHSRFLLKGMFDDVINLSRVDRLVFFWGGGFDLGGPWLRSVLETLGASRTAEWPALVVRCSDPKSRAEAAGEFLVEEEDSEGQFAIVEGEADLSSVLFAITFENDETRVHLTFDDSGVQDWAFVAMLPQLHDEDPSLRPARGG